MQGRRPNNIDDAISTIACRTGYTMTMCECDRPEACDGSWIRVDGSGKAYCDAYNRAELAAKKIPAVLAKATCARLLVRVSSPYMKYDGGNKQPSAKCPPNYRLMSCSFISTFSHKETPSAKVIRSGGKCFIKKPCLRCKVQANCLRSMKV